MSALGKHGNLKAISPRLHGHYIAWTRENRTCYSTIEVCSSQNKYINTKIFFDEKIHPQLSLSLQFDYLISLIKLKTIYKKLNMK